MVADDREVAAIRLYCESDEDKQGTSSPRSSEHTTSTCCLRATSMIEFVSNAVQMLAIVHFSSSVQKSSTEAN
jgi:hypothetical protein